MSLSVLCPLASCVIVHDPVSLTPWTCLLLQGPVSYSRVLFLTPGTCLLLQGPVSYSRDLSLTPGSCFFLQVLFLSPGSCFLLQGPVSFSRVLFLPPESCFLLQGPVSCSRSCVNKPLTSPLPRENEKLKKTKTLFRKFTHKILSCIAIISLGLESARTQCCCGI
jgi:hypothetical protein